MRSKRYKKKELKRWHKVLITVGVIIGTAILLELFLIARAGFKLHNLGLLDWQIEKAHELSDDESNILSDDEIMYEGEKYRLNDELITILVMGIDSQYYVKKVEGKNCGNQSDANFLLLLDGKKQEIRVIAISRDTITKLRTYDPKGEPLGYTRAQLALQYAYGDGGQGSCELTKEAVSHLMYGVPISLYASINMGAVPSINNAVGGVKIVAPIKVIIS
jgi:anionic cell wall polymer biosynthesis LytR-Cps2A-Psr (LCP) family protein